MEGVLRDLAFDPAGGQALFDQVFDLDGEFADGIGPVGDCCGIGPERKVVGGHVLVARSSLGGYRAPQTG